MYNEQMWHAPPVISIGECNFDESSWITLHKVALCDSADCGNAFLQACADTNCVQDHFPQHLHW